MIRPLATIGITYDYRNQAWVVNGLYEDCGHPFECGCYGRIHSGEPVVCIACDRAASLYDESETSHVCDDCRTGMNL